MERNIILGGSLPEEVSRELQSYPVFLQKILFNRGLTTFAEAEEFLNIDYEQGSFDPFLIKGMDKAVKRILIAIKKNEKIMIYSDYDADGIPGAVVLHDFFKKIGFLNFANYIPHRLKEGYGLNTTAIEKFIVEKVSVLITIDCGITNVTETELAMKNGIDVIITDHHLVGEKLPPAWVILNSKQADDHYPDEMLCGAGVVFKLVQGLIRQGGFGLAKGWEKWLLDLVGLATIADQVPLKKENRVLAKYGLRVLRKSPRIGLKKLLQKIKIDQRQINEDDIGFMLAPRINAASRIADPRITFDLLSTQDEILADDWASQLNKLNDQRKVLVATAVREAKKKIKERGLKSVVVVGSPDWNLGLSGLIASSLKDCYGRPCFVWGTNKQGDYCGSCRSGTVDLTELMSRVGGDFFSYKGGHKMAAGFGIVKEQIYFFEEKILDAFEKIKFSCDVEKIFVDSRLGLDEVNWDNYQLLERLAPFGKENEKPLFLFENLLIETARSFGKAENHLELTFKNSQGNKIKAIDFFSQTLQKKEGSFLRGQTISFLANFEKNTFNQKDELRLKLKEIL